MTATCRYFSDATIADARVWKAQTDSWSWCEGWLWSGEWSKHRPAVFEDRRPAIEALELVLQSLHDDYDEGCDLSDALYRGSIE